jgi:hypothetical protein
MREKRTAARLPSSSLPQNSQFFRPTATERMWLSTELVSISTRGSWRKTSSRDHWLRA